MSFELRAQSQHYAPLGDRTLCISPVNIRCSSSAWRVNVWKSSSARKWRSRAN